MAGRSAQPHNFDNQMNNNQMNNYQMNNSLHTKKTQGQNSQGRRMGLVCNHCGYKGHTRESCYRIVGFPADFKSKRKGSGSVNEAYANNFTSESSGSGSASNLYFLGGYFTKEQYEQVTKILSPFSPTRTCRAEANAAGPCPLLSPFLDNVDDASNDINLDPCHTHIEEISNNSDGLQETGLSGAKTVSTPLEFNEKLTSVVFDQYTGGSDDAELEDVTSYQRLIGKLLCLTITRPDICFSVQVLSQFLQNPKVSHWETTLRVVRYIKKSPGLGVMLRRGTGVTKLTGYCDLDWASCPNTRRSITGYMVKLGDSIISWKSKKQKTVSRSSAEAEYRSLAALVAELIWLAGLLNELHFPGSTQIL
uniref:CCHC-type domain-containing protein n=1 Tax=Solanum lycopersicum TaxID=4081 RepID=A0A3Q7IW65_SOLLC